MSAQDAPITELSSLIAENSHIEFTATYSAEDDKLRIYSSERYSKALYKYISDLGFNFAPTQDLVFAKWTPERVDLCYELAGDVTPEQTTIVERAEQKADRLDGYAHNAAERARGYYASAKRIMERIECGQPILRGHHSEKRAVRDRNKVQRAMSNVSTELDKFSYFGRKAEGVERYANMKADPGVRSRRIKGLLEEMRKYQRRIDDYHVYLMQWESIQKSKDRRPDIYKKGVEYFLGFSYSPGHIDKALRAGDIDHDQAVADCIEFYQGHIDDPYNQRWIVHLLNRLAFESLQLGKPPRFSGKLTATILKAFLRTHGVEKPDVKKVDGKWTFKTGVPLPLHLGDGKELALTDTEWCDLMEATLYDVPAPKAKLPPILNFKADKLLSRSRKPWEPGDDEYQQVTMTKAEFTDIHKDQRGVRTSSCNTFRFRTCVNPDRGGPIFLAVFLSDSKVSPTPESKAVCFDEPTPSEEAA